MRVVDAYQVFGIRKQYGWDAIAGSRRGVWGGVGSVVLGVRTLLLGVNAAVPRLAQVDDQARPEGAALGHVGNVEPLLVARFDGEAG